MEGVVHCIDARFLKEPHRRNDNERFVRNYFLACLAVITSISVYDAYLVVAYKSLIIEFEQNPICLALIELDPSGLTYFLLGKALGTFCVIAALTVLYIIQKKHWLIVSSTVAAFQIGLLGFLTFR